MLIHMTPGEVNSLQGLAMAHGGSLTINPQTGLPEAGWLGKLLPTILGAALAATGVGAPLAAGIVGAGQFARTGSLKKGLMAGLGAFGGAGMAGMAGLGGSLSQTGFGALSNNAGMFGANMGQGISQGVNAASGIAKLGSAPLENAINVTGTMPGAPVATALNPVQAQALTGGAIGSGTQAALTGVAPTAATGAGAQFTGGLGSRFGQAVRAGLPAGTPGIISKAAPMLGVSGVLGNVSSAMTPKQGTMGDDGVVDNSYAGPYTSQIRSVSYPGQLPVGSSDSSDHLYFSNSMPEVYNMQGQVVQPGSSTKRGTPILQNVLNPNAKKGQNRYNQILTPYMTSLMQDEEDMGYSKGGELQIADGGFIVDARSVAEGGKGYTDAGFAEFEKLGGVPIKGPGDGVSDSIPARIGGTQPARVAAGEVYMSPEAVRRIGKGNPKRGANKLYAMMNEAHKATKRGQERNILSGLA
jgi:hypothetical protein